MDYQTMMTFGSFAPTVALALYIFMSVKRSVDKNTAALGKLEMGQATLIGQMKDVEKDTAKEFGKLEALQGTVYQNETMGRERLHELGNKFADYPRRDEMDRRISESEGRSLQRVDRLEKTIMDMLNEIKNDVKAIRDNR